MQGMTPNAAVIAASPMPFPDCRFCGAVGVQTLMRKLCGVPRTVFLHPECEAVLRKRGAITETWYGEQRTTLQAIDDASAAFYAERGNVSPNAAHDGRGKETP